VQEALKYNYSGFNIDFEPDNETTVLDAQKYAQFLQKFGKALQSAGKKLGVDVASWNRIWNFTLLGADSAIDTIHDMDTYDYGDDIQKWTEEAMKVFGLGYVFWFVFGLTKKKKKKNKQLIMNRLFQGFLGIRSVLVLSLILC
jgi:hypothetical protein